MCFYQLKYAQNLYLANTLLYIFDINTLSSCPANLNLIYARQKKINSLKEHIAIIF